MHNLNLKDSFSPVTLTRAHDIVRRNKVFIDSDEVEPQAFLAGRVQGTRSTPYEIEIFFEFDEHDTEFVCVCDCPIGFGCKHAAALLIFWDSNQKAATLNSTPSVLDKRRQQLATALNDDTTSIQWVDGLMAALNNAEQKPRTLYPAAPDNIRLIYELRRIRVPSGMTLGVRVMQAATLKNGDLGKGRHYPLDSHFGYCNIADNSDDEEILDLLRVTLERNNSQAGTQDSGVVPLLGKTGAYLLSQMLSTGKLYWHDEREQACQSGPEKTATVQWEALDSDEPGARKDTRKDTRKTGPKMANQARGKSASSTQSPLRITTDLHSNGELFLADTQPIWYIDPQRFVAGIVESSYSPAVLNAATNAPRLPARAAQAIANMLVSHTGTTQMPLPAEPSVVVVKDTMQCQLRIYSADGSAHVNQWTVQVLMCYGEHRFHVDLRPDSAVSCLTLDDGREVEVRRDHDREYRQYQFFRRRVSGFEPVFARDPERFTIADHQPLARSLEERFYAFERLFDAFDSLRSEDFKVIVEPPVSLESETVTDFNFDLQPIDNGWFDLALQLRHEGTSYNLLPLILQWLARGERDTALNVVSADGRRLKVPAEMVRPVADTLLELYDDSSQGVAVSRARALSLGHLDDELRNAGAQSEWQGDKELLALATKIETVSANQDTLLASAKAPRTLKAELRPYQLTGMAWLDFLHSAGLSGVLADDMGLGKTIQTLAHILSLKQRRKLTGPCLVVAPTSVLQNWEREAQRFAPILKVRVWHGAERHEHPLEEEDALLVVTSYSLALRDQARLAAHGFTFLVLDEAQTIKNPAAKITQTLKRMPIEHRLCLTGTPLENHLGELWSLYDFLMPGLLGPQKRFTAHFRTPIEKHGDSERQQRLNNAIAPFMLRRRKHAVAADLPAKTEIITKIELDADQARLYETIRIGMEKRVRKLLQERGVAKSHIQMLDALLKLRQCCCHPALVKLDSAKKVKNSAKTSHVLSMISELIAEGRTIILFSQFTQMLDLLEKELKAQSIGYVKLTGKTRKRQEAIDAFQGGQVPLFLISLKAGGTGLNLTAADTVIHYDPWWNPAVENQATDRAHRIGQDKPVFVYKLIADNTVEDKIVAMQARKQSLADATMERGEANPIKALSKDDILSLFAD